MQFRTIARAAGAGLVLLAAPAAADDFYKGRQITLVIGNTPGTSYDASARLMARHLGAQIPGQPTVVTQNMPGATGLTAANFVANVAPKDGSVIANAHQSLPMRQVLGDKAVRYDAAKLQWIGSPDYSNNVMTVWHTVPIKTIEDVRTRPVIMGATTRRAANSIEVALANNLVGTKFKLVTGYTAADIDIAVERGEVEGRAGQSWAGVKTVKPEWVREGKIRVIAQLGLKRDPELTDVPLLLELARDDEGRRIIELFSAQVALGRPLYAAEGVPEARVAALRTAFARTMASPGFLEDAKRSNHDVNPVSGAELEAIVARMMATPPELAAKAVAAQDYKE